MDKMTWRDAAFIAGGLAAGAGGSELRHFLKKKDQENTDDWEGVEFGAIAAAVSGIAGLAFDSKEILELGVGAGIGAASADICRNVVKKRKIAGFRIMGQEPLIRRWQAIIDIPPDLDDAEKEKIIIPLLRDLAIQASRNPALLVHPQYALPPEVKDRYVQAAGFMSNLLGIDPLNPPSIIRMQKWFHLEGVRKGGYEANESMTHPNPEMRRPDVDRFRLLPLLMDVWQSDGKIRFDCDDSVFAVNAVQFYNGWPAWAGVISQQPDKYPHHVFPIAMLKPGELYGLECIREIPPFPLSEVERVYRPLTRFVLVDPMGGFHDVPLRGN
jgi:hypothetical protein